MRGEEKRKKRRRAEDAAKSNTRCELHTEKKTGKMQHAFGVLRAETENLYI